MQQRKVADTESEAEAGSPPVANEGILKQRPYFITTMVHE